MQSYYGFVLSATGGVVPSCSVKVLNVDNTLAAIYSDNGVTSKANPFVTDTDSEFSFFAANGTYTVQVYKTGFTSGQGPEIDSRQIHLFDVEDSMVATWGDLLSLKALLLSVPSVVLLNGVYQGALQFRGALDSTASLGTLGFVFDADSDGAAAALLIASSPEYASPLNGASLQGAQHVITLPADCSTIHVGQLGMTAPMQLASASPVRAADKEFVKLTITEPGVRSIIIYEGPPTDFAGVPGTGSARQVTVYGMREAD